MGSAGYTPISMREQLFCQRPWCSHRKTCVNCNVFSNATYETENILIGNDYCFPINKYPFIMAYMVLCFTSLAVYQNCLTLDSSYSNYLIP